MTDRMEDAKKRGKRRVRKEERTTVSVRTIVQIREIRNGACAERVCAGREEGEKDKSREEEEEEKGLGLARHARLEERDTRILCDFCECFEGA